MYILDAYPGKKKNEARKRPHECWVLLRRIQSLKKEKRRKKKTRREGSNSSSFDTNETCLRVV